MRNFCFLKTWMDAEEDLDLVKRPEKFQTYGGYSKGMIFTLS